MTIYSFARQIPVIGKWMFLLFDRKRGVELAAAAIAEELEMNADVASRTEPHGSAMRPADLTFDFSAWDTYGMAARPLSHHRSNPELFADVVRVYSALKASARDGSWPPLAEDLRVVAERLKRAKF